ncbi:7967_t:CDS:1, partial [Scutellospora calospora]
IIPDDLNQDIRDIKKCPDCPHNTMFIYDFILLIEDEHGSTLSTLVNGGSA